MLNRLYWILRDLAEPSPMLYRGLERARRRWDLRRDPLLTQMLLDLGPGCVVFDIGAGVGLYSVVLSSQLEGARVIAFEPNPATRARLSKAIELEDAQASVEVSPLALGDRIESRTFFVSSQLGRSSLRTFNAQRGGAMVADECEVRCTTIDELVETGQYPAPDALKIDVEGYEYEVILGAERTIALHRPRIYFDTHAREGPQQSAPLIQEFLAQFGYGLEHEWNGDCFGLSSPPLP